MITVTTAQRSEREHTMCYQSEMLSILSMQVNLQWSVLILRWKNEKQNYHNVGTAPKLNRTIVLIGKIDTPNTHIHYRFFPLAWNHLKRKRRS